MDRDFAYYLFQDAGLKDICIEAGIVAEGSINGVLDGKHYNRAVRGTGVSMAASTPVPVANRTLAYWALESGLRPHELKIDRPRTVRAQLN